MPTALYRYKPYLLKLGYTPNEEYTCTCFYYYDKFYPNGRVRVHKASKCHNKNRVRKDYCKSSITFYPTNGEAKQKVLSMPRDVNDFLEILREWGVEMS